jgi:hypothetical protein
MTASMTRFDFEQGRDLIDVRDYGAHSVADLTIASSGVTVSLTSTACRWTAWAMRHLAYRSRPSSDFILSGTFLFGQVAHRSPAVGDSRLRFKSLHFAAALPPSLICSQGSLLLA